MDTSLKPIVIVEDYPIVLPVPQPPPKAADLCAGGDAFEAALLSQ